MEIRYHFGDFEEACRVLKLNESFSHSSDLNHFQPHKILLVTQTPFDSIIGTNLPRFGVLSSDGASILYGGIMYNYRLDENKVGFLGEIIESKSELVEAMNMKEHTINVVRYLVDGE